MKKSENAVKIDPSLTKDLYNMSVSEIGHKCVDCK